MKLSGRAANSNAPLEQIPATVQVVKGEEMQKQNSLSIADYMTNNMPGVTVNDTQNNPYQPDISFRGFSASPLVLAYAELTYTYSRLRAERETDPDLPAAFLDSVGENAEHADGREGPGEADRRLRFLGVIRIRRPVDQVGSLTMPSGRVASHSSVPSYPVRRAISSAMATRIWARVRDIGRVNGNRADLRL